MANDTLPVGADDQSPSPDTKVESLLELVCLKKWDEAKQRVNEDPECIYALDRNGNGRLVIHELCKLISFPANLIGNEGELSDDDDDEAPDQRPLPACLDCVVDDNLHICELASHMIKKSHELGPVRVCFPAETAGNADEGDEEANMNPNDVQGDDVRVEVHESILTVTDSLAKTPLHILCEQSVDTDLLRVILSNTRDQNKNPSAPTAFSLITAKDSRGSTPLHYLAFSRQCPIGALSLMMDYCKPSTEDPLNTDPTICVDNDGDTPVHWALEGYMSPRRVQQLIRYSQAAFAIKNAAEKLPFDLFVGNFVDNEWKEHDVTGKEAWESIQAYLKIIANHTEKSGEWMPIHMLSASKINFPEVFYDIALHFCKEDVSKCDAEGMLPLHLASARVGMLKGSEPADNTMAYKLLLEYPQAAYKATAKTKRLPIHFAVSTRKPLKLIAVLLKAYPNSLNVKDPVTGLWPFLLSAVDNDDSIDTSYSMLRADPSIVQLAISALISKRGQRAQQALRQMGADELEDYSHRRFRRLKLRDGYD